MAAQTFVDNIVGIPQLWECIKAYVKSNSVNVTTLSINTKTGHLTTAYEGKLRFSLDASGHLISEVEN